MFIHNFKYLLKTLFRNKMLIFWTFAFPIILGTLFEMAFSNLENNEKLKIIDIAIIENEAFEESQVYKTAFKELSNENNKDRLFNIKYTTMEKAKELLDKGDIAGIVEIKNDSPVLTFNTNGIDQTILKFAVEEIEQTTDIIKNLSEMEAKNQLATGNFNIDYEKIYENVKENDFKLKNISNENLSYTMIEFYTLIAMTCLYGGMLAMVSINQTLANMSDKGKRISVAPTKKGTVILSSLLASYIVQLLGLLIIFTYTILVLKVDYGNQFLRVALLSAIGTLAGLSLGTFIGTIFKVNENTKVGILIAFTMLCSFLSGMMGVTMKYVVDKNVPIINKLNPASMITDGFYSLYYYTTFERYWLNIISLVIFAFVLILISFFSLRRQKYDSI